MATTPQSSVGFSGLIPGWDQLVANSFEYLADYERKELDRLRAQTPPRIMGFGRKVVSGLFKDPAIHKFAGISWSDLVEVLASQMSENRRLKENARLGYRDQALKPYPKAANIPVDRRFSQLPCTKNTVEKRCEIAIKHCSLDDPILLLGDDDLVSIGLAKQGFSNIHVIDIDPKVLRAIDAIAEREGYKISTHLQDLCASLSTELPTNFKMAFFDPFYSLEGVKIFLDAAKKLTQNQENPIYFLSIHLMSLMRPGIERLTKQLEDMGVEPLEIMPSFNAYPVPKSIKLLVHLVNKAVIKNRIMCSEGNSFNLFVSDAIILQRKK